jgi:putative component of toxin-antitoxin plasmid stabilization module
VKPVGEGFSELRIAYGRATGSTTSKRVDGSRVARGGDKSSQQRDIEEAKRVTADWKSHG